MCRLKKRESLEKFGNDLVGRRPTTQSHVSFYLESFRGFAIERGATATSPVPFHESSCFLVERGIIGFSRLQIKFVDHDLHQRGGGDREKKSE